MKVSKEIILKLYFTDDEVKVLKSALEKSIKAESASHLAIGILSKDEVNFLEQVIKAINE